MEVPTGALDGESARERGLGIGQILLERLHPPLMVIGPANARRMFPALPPKALVSMTPVRLRTLSFTVPRVDPSSCSIQVDVMRRLGVP